MKYNYKEGQWAPNNTEGKKQYDRDFLIQLQKDPLSLAKPTNLPNMEIIKDKANADRNIKANFMGKPDFMPPYVKQTISKGMTKNGSRNGGKKKDMMGGKSPIVVTGLSFQEKVELKTAENAWKPSQIKKTAAPENGEADSTMEILAGKVSKQIII